MLDKFDSGRLVQDFDAAVRRKKISRYRAAVRCGIDPGTLAKIRTGEIQHITVTTMAKMLNFIGTTNIEKYLYSEGEQS